MTKFYLRSLLVITFSVIMNHNIMNAASITLIHPEINSHFEETILSVKKMTGIDLVFVQGGTFEMGNDEGVKDEKPAHTVSVADYYIGKYEITIAQYNAFCKTTGRELPFDDGKDYDKYPVNHINWLDANEYCNWLGQKTGLKFRLPTEAEWEYAAHGGQNSQNYKYAGSNNIDEVAWNPYNSNYETHPIGTKAPNELGIYDMSGNVWEWCSDWYSGDYYKISSVDNPKGPKEGNAKVLRGGSYRYDYSCYVDNRDGNSPRNSQGINVGLRVVLSYN